MIRIIYSTSFVRELKHIERKDKDLHEEILEKIKLFKKRENHSKLRVHKLHGQLSKYWSFSVNYKFRILYRPESPNRVIFIDIDDHDIYK